MSPVRIPRPVAPWKAGIVVVRPQLLGTSERKNGFPASTPWVFWTDSSGFVKHFRSFGPPLPEQRKYAYHIISYIIYHISISYLHLVSYFQLSQEVTSLLRLLSLHRENCQQNNLRLCQENGKVFCQKQLSSLFHTAEKNRASLCFLMFFF